LKSDRPELADAARVLGRVLTAAFRDFDPGSGPAETPHADPDLLLAAWRAGVPAFRAGEAPPLLDRDALRRRGVAVCEALAADNPAAGRFAASVRDGRADLHDWALVVLGDDPGVPRAPASKPVRSVAPDARVEDNPWHPLPRSIVEASPEIDPALARSVLRLALLPVLAPHAARLDALRPEGLWTRGECPDCGGPPVLAESRGLEQRRHWRCGVCAGDWPGDRLRCPICGETDHRRLSYRFVEGEHDRYRLALCDSCGASLPAVSTLAPLSAPALLVAELATAHLAALAEPPP
jgi:hypothetical protein